MIRQLFLILSTLFVSYAHGQLSFNRLYGEGRAYVVHQLPDSGYLVAGDFDSAFYKLPFVMKTNITGEPQWVVKYKGEATSHVMCLVPTSNGFCLTIASFSNDSTRIIFLNNFGYALNAIQVPGQIRSVCICSDGSIAATGNHRTSNIDNNIIALKFTETGNILWSRDYITGSSWDIGMCILEVENNNLLVAGCDPTVFGTQYHGVMMKLSSAGTEIYNRRSYYSADIAFYSVVYINNTYVFSGNASTTQGGSKCMAIMVTDTQLTIQDIKYRGGIYGGRITSSIVNSEGNPVFLMNAYTTCPTVTVLLTDTSYSPQWERNFDDYNSPFGAEPYGFEQTNDSGYIIAAAQLYGASNIPFVSLIKIDNTGHLGCGDDFLPYSWASISMTSMNAYSNPSALGSTPVQVATIYTGVDDSTRCMTNPQELYIVENITQVNFSIFPNPCTDVIQINSDASSEQNFVINNSYGQEILRGTFQNSTEINTQSLAPGLYLIMIENTTRAFSKY